MSTHMIGNKVYTNCLIVVYYQPENEHGAWPVSIINVQDDYAAYMYVVLNEQKYLSGANLLLSSHQYERQAKRKVRNIIGHATSRGRELLVKRLRKKGFSVHSVSAPDVNAFYEYNNPPEHMMARIKVIELV